MSLATVFNLQRALVRRFIEVEVSNGAPRVDYPVDLYTIAGQSAVRGTLWNIIEEAAEADAASRAELREELSDVLHYLCNLCLAVLKDPVEPILAYYHNPDDLMRHLHNTHSSAAGVFDTEKMLVQFNRRMHLITRDMKAKPWKTEVMVTQEQAWEITKASLSLMRYFLVTLSCYGIRSDDELLSLYHFKHLINEKRLATP